MTVNKETLFKRLTKLFRSGHPVIHRRIREIEASRSASSVLDFFSKSHSNAYSEAMGSYGSFDRLSRLADASEMDYTPEIASALDIYADESIATDEHGRSLHIYSENNKIQELLGELFYDTLNVEFNLRSWVRSLCKYGDFFLFNNINSISGITNVFPIPVNEVEREEGFDPSDPLAIRFRWITQGNQVLENWQVSHMRLLGNDAFLPYGSSILEPARRIYRQLILIEDAMLVYRVMRSPERRVFYIDVGAIPPEDVPTYLEQAKTALRTRSVVDRTTGKLDLRHAPLPIKYNNIIPLLSGENKTIKELSEEYEKGKVNWIYSIQDKTHKVVPGKIIWCGKNYTANKIVKITLDNGICVETAPEHLFILRNGEEKRADRLLVNDSLMPLYTFISSKETKNHIFGYEKIYNPETNDFKYTHRLISNDWCINKGKISKNKRKVIHHINFNKRDNHPYNLQEMEWYEHRNYHYINANKNKNTEELLKYNKSSLHKKHNKIRSIAMKKLWSNASRSKKTINNMTIKFDKNCFKFLKKEILNCNEYTGIKNIVLKLRNNNDFIDYYKKINNFNKRDVSKFNKTILTKKIKNIGYKNYFDFVANTIKDKNYFNCSNGKRAKTIYDKISKKNHKIIHIEIVNEVSDVYCMTVVGPSGENDRHNFAVLGTNFNNLKISDINGIFIKNSVDSDYFIPVRGTESGTKIDTLPGGVNATAIDDVKYLQSKLFAALKVPKAYLGYDESLSSKATLAAEDIRFSRSIQYIQKVALSELNKLAIIHLFSNGFEGEDLLDFSLQLSNPSAVAQQQKLELYRTKFEIAATAPAGLLSRTYILKNVFELSDKEIELLEIEKTKDKLNDAKLEKVVISEPEPETAAKEKSTEKESKAPIEEIVKEVENDISELSDNSKDNNDNDSQLSHTHMPIVRINPQIQRFKHNRSRRRTHGASKTHMPDFNAMLSANNQSLDPHSFKDLYISPTTVFKEGTEDLEFKEVDNFYNKKITENANMTLEIQGIINNLKNKKKLKVTE